MSTARSVIQESASYIQTSPPAVTVWKSPPAELNGRSSVRRTPNVLFASRRARLNDSFSVTVSSSALSRTGLPVCIAWTRR
jgi:hypothetical protein